MGAGVRPALLRKSGWWGLSYAISQNALIQFWIGGPGTDYVDPLFSYVGDRNRMIKDAAHSI